MTDRVLTDLVFSEPVGFRPLSLDLHLPDADGAPLVVFYHGGGWRVGSRHMFVPTMKDVDAFGVLTESGLAVASVDYRLSGEATFPAQRDDATAALAWLRSNAEEFGFDPTRIVLWGESAGATIAALVGLADSDICGVVDWYGPSDLTAMATALGQLDDPETREAGWLGGTVGSLSDLARQASPVAQVHTGSPPFLIAHGLADTAVPYAQSEALAEALAAAGADVDLELVPGAGHMWSGDVDRMGLLARAIAFVRTVTA
jgi:acetyl esterase/lipase